MDSSIDQIRTDYFIKEVAYYVTSICKIPVYKDREKPHIRDAILEKVRNHASKLNDLINFLIIYNESLWLPTKPNDYGNIMLISCRSKDSARRYIQKNRYIKRIYFLFRGGLDERISKLR